VGISLVTSAKGNVAQSILLTVATNTIGVIAIPLWLKATLQAGKVGPGPARGRGAVWRGRTSCPGLGGGSVPALKPVCSAATHGGTLGISRLAAPSTRAAPQNPPGRRG
jgi:hypothetical protein